MKKYIYGDNMEKKNILKHVATLAIILFASVLFMVIGFSSFSAAVKKLDVSTTITILVILAIILASVLLIIFLIYLIILAHRIRTRKNRYVENEYVEYNYVEEAKKEVDREAMKEALEDVKQAKKDVEQAKKDMQRFKSNMNNNSDTDPEDVSVSIDESGIELHVTEDGKKKKIRLNNNFSN